MPETPNLSIVAVERITLELLAGEPAAVSPPHGRELI
jgi:hypothetical protein